MTEEIIGAADAVPNELGSGFPETVDEVENTVTCAFKALETVPRAVEIQLVNDLVATGIDSRLRGNLGHSVTVR